MKIRSDIHAGDALRTCQQQRDYWKAQAIKMEGVAKSTYVPPVYNPPVVNPPVTPPVTGGGYVSGQWYSDHSGWCG